MSKELGKFEKIWFIVGNEKKHSPAFRLVKMRIFTSLQAGEDAHLHLD